MPSSSHCMRSPVPVNAPMAVQAAVSLSVKWMVYVASATLCQVIRTPSAMLYEMLWMATVNARTIPPQKPEPTL